MKSKAIEIFKEILSESDWQKVNDDFIANSRTNQTRAEDLSEDDDKEEPVEDDDLSNEENIENDEDSKADPGEIKIKNGLEYVKLKSALNQFRASRSLNDDDVNQELKKFFKRLSDDEKKVLYALIKGLTQVTLLDVSGKTAFIPSDLGFKVSKPGSTSREKLKSKETAQKLSKNSSDDEIADMTNTPVDTMSSSSIIKVGGSNEGIDETLLEIKKLVTSNA